MTRDSSNGATSPVEYLAAPSALPVHGQGHRSISPSPSGRSSHSHVTFFEGKEDDPESDKAPVSKRQTFKVGLKITWWDLIKGFFNRKVLTKKIENSIEVIRPSSDTDKMFPEARSPFDIEVHISPKDGSRKDEKVRCLLDTGCLPGNIVSRGLVDSLGYEPDDFESLTFAEKEGFQGLTGERLTFDAAILLSWYHDTMPSKFRDMRFLISPESNVEMIIGTNSILKYKILAPPVLPIVKPPVPKDREIATINKAIAGLEESVKNYEKELGEEQAKVVSDKKKIQQIKNKIEEKEHFKAVKGLEMDARIAHLHNDTIQENKLKSDIEKEKSDYEAKVEDRKKRKAARKTGETAPAVNKRLAATSAGPRGSTP